MRLDSLNQNVRLSESDFFVYKFPHRTEGILEDIWRRFVLRCRHSFKWDEIFHKF